MKIAYIAGPYRAKTQPGIEKNIRKASHLAAKYWKLGYAVICPHKNASHLDGTVADEVFLAGCLEILRLLRPGQDVLVMMKTWKESEGATREHELGKELGIEVIYE
jgi:hypothetical protein